jgi:CrcB protein
VVWKLLLIAAAGGLGTLARYGLAGAVQNLAGRTFPWGTVVVNVLGCFVFGALWSAMQDRLAVSVQMRQIVLVGFMGAFTTFSTFVFETGQLTRDAQWIMAAGNLALQNGVGLAALFAGLTLGRLL